MESYSIRIEDLSRILFGQLPAEFYLELVIRAAFVFFVLILAMRLIGKRISARVNRNELAAMSTLAAGTGLMIMTPERGLLPSLLVVLFVIGAQKLVNTLNFRHRGFERLTQGALSILVKDGVMDLKEMTKIKVSREQLMAQLRGHELDHLGQVSRLYLESNGSFTLIKNEKKAAGLSVIPKWDNDFLSSQPKSDNQVCGRCGHIREPAEQNCSNCGHSSWEQAVTAEE